MLDSRANSVAPTLASESFGRNHSATMTGVDLDTASDEQAEAPPALTCVPGLPPLEGASTPRSRHPRDGGGSGRPPAVQDSPTAPHRCYGALKREVARRFMGAHWTPRPSCHALLRLGVSTRGYGVARRLAARLAVGLAQGRRALAGLRDVLLPGRGDAAEVVRSGRRPTPAVAPTPLWSGHLLDVGPVLIAATVRREAPGEHVPTNARDPTTQNLGRLRERQGVDSTHHPRLEPGACAALASLPLSGSYRVNAFGFRRSGRRRGG